MKINTKLSALCVAATLLSAAQVAAAAPAVSGPANAAQPSVAVPSATVPTQVPAPAASASVATPAPAQAPSVPATTAPAAGSVQAATPAAPSAPAPRPSASVAPAAAPSVPSTAKPSKPDQPSTSAPAAATATSVNPTQLDKLNHESAIPLVLEAQSRYQYAISGGKSLGQAFQLNGKSYRYLSEDIGTKTKLINYLTQAYTKQASEQFVGKFFVEVNGRLAQLNADGGNLLEFSRATAKMVTMTPVKRSYLLTVPYPAETKQANEKITVNFEKVGSYWKVSSAPHVIF
ncbi:IseA DL-endopeptidase inhibitor family protein [Paenibacillus sp. BT-177]|uniref:IseA DL-endopeptidase inhibitor family protein n=1 Tax=Paenibacillus sp. BT-177 TaxID=2986930 RepID=UPI0021F7B1A2|nr:IseA DL-endopeptidase inhibitor family protein [Paenibacillus sp. BT-177]